MPNSSIPPGTTIEIETCPGGNLYRFCNDGPGVMEILDGGGRTHRLPPGGECDVGKGDGQALEVRCTGDGDRGAAELS